MKSSTVAFIIVLAAIALIWIVFFSSGPEEPTQQTSLSEEPAATAEPTAGVDETPEAAPTPTPKPDLAGYVINTSGEALAGVVVRASGTETVAQTDSDGYFQFAEVDGVTTTLHVNHDPYFPTTLTGLNLPTGDAVFVLCRGASIRGRVTNMLSRPQADIQVERGTASGNWQGPAPLYKKAAKNGPSDAPWQEIIERIPKDSIHQVCLLHFSQEKSTTTDEDGRYSMDGMRQGFYHVRVRDENLVAEPHERLALDWEETLDGIDFRVAPGYRIRGKAFEAKSEAPVAGVTVSHYITGATAVTGQDGTYALGPVSRGRYSLSVNTPPGYIVADLSFGQRGPEANVANQDVEGIDIKLEKAGTIRGRVVDSNGHSVAKGRVSLSLESINPMTVGPTMMRLGRLMEGTRTDEDGRFELTGIPEGKGYILCAAASEYPPGKYGPLDLGYGETKEDVEIVLPESASVYGTVSSKEGEPVPDYHVACIAGENYLAAMTQIPNREAIKRTVTDQEGKYSIEHVATGKNVVVVAHREVPGGGGLPKNQQVVDVAGPTEVNFSIDVPKLEGTISGRITTSKGEPVQQAGVLAMHKNLMMVQQEGGSQEARVEEDGRYKIENLIEGSEYSVMVLRTEGPVNPAQLFQNAISKTAKASAENVDFTLPGEGSISGRVVYKLTGRPVPSFSISATRKNEDNPMGSFMGMIEGMFGGKQANQFDSADGSFLLQDLVAGSYTLVVNGEGFSAATVEGIGVIEDQTTEDVVIEVEGGGGIEGIVMDAATKAPIEGALVTAYPGGTNSVFSLMGMNLPDPDEVKTTSDSEGKFSFMGLDEGQVSLRATHPQYAPQSVGPVSISSEGTQKVDIPLNQGGRIEGHVYDANGNPRPGVQLNIVSVNGDENISTTADNEGFYSQDNVPPGHYVVTYPFMDIITGTHNGSMQGTGEVQNGQTTVIDIGGGAGVTVTGIVQSGGQPVPGVQVLFIRGSEANFILPGGTLAETTTNPDGTYRATGVPGGPAKILIVRMNDLLTGGAPLLLHRQEVELPESGEIQIDIQLQLVTLGGTVRDAESNEPIADAMLMMFRDFSGGERTPFELRVGGEGGIGTGQATTGPDGRYLFEEVAPGDYVITCRAENYGQQGVEVSVGAQPIGDVDVQMPKQVGEVSGRVIDSQTGRAVQTAFVYLIDQYGQMVMPTGLGITGMITDESGQFKIDSVAPGAYALLAGDPLTNAYGWTRIEGVVAQAGEVTDLEIELERGASVAISLVDPQGQPLLGAEWKLFDSRGTSMAGQTMAVGNTVRTSLVPGQYTARAELRGFQPVEFPFTVEEGQATFEQIITAQPM